MANSTTKCEQKLIIDTDAGLDDANAILMALAHASAKVIAISTVQGNTNAKQVARNVLRLLKVCDRLDLPVFRGCDKPMTGVEEDASYYHGKDGFGDVPDPNPPDENLLQAEHSVMALSRLSKQYEGELTLVCLGPLTNIAMTLRLDPGFGKRLKECFIMGGNYTGFGNVTPTSEFNFHNDPEAAFVVLRELGCQITVMPWEPCRKQTLSLDIHQELTSMDTPKAKFMKTIQQKTLKEFYEKNDESRNGFILCDELAMACALEENTITKSSQEYATVALDGTMTRGQMIVHWEWIERPTERRNVRIVKKVNYNQVIQLLQDSLK